MSKVIRIENADTSDFKVTVEIWDKGQNGKPDVKREGFCPLHFPTNTAPQRSISGTTCTLVSTATSRNLRTASITFTESAQCLSLETVVLSREKEGA